MNNVERIQKVIALQTKYYANGVEFLTLYDAQQYAMTFGRPNKDGMLVISRPLSSVGATHVKNWYGRINYGPEKYTWTERVELASAQRI